jgi:hypothetical protein
MICITCQLFTVVSLTTLQINTTVVLLYSSPHHKFSSLLHFKITIYTITRFSLYCMVISPCLPCQFSHAHSVLASLDSFVFSAPNINKEPQESQNLQIMRVYLTTDTPHITVDSPLISLQTCEHANFFLNTVKKRPVIVKCSITLLFRWVI